MSANSTKTFSWKTAILLSVTVGLLATGLSVFLQIQSVKGFDATDSKSATLTSARIEPKSSLEAPEPAWYLKNAIGVEAVSIGSSFEAPGKSVRLLIPSIGVDAAIQSVGLSAKNNGEMGIPTNFTDVAWYNEGTAPGMPGSAVIAGHLDGKKVPKAVFYDLNKLKPGNLVEVVDIEGKILKFQVIRSQIYDYNAPTTDIFSSHSSKPRLNLITCGGSWIKSQKLYNKRIVVFTELVTTD